VYVSVIYNGGAVFRLFARAGAKPGGVWQLLCNNIPAVPVGPGASDPVSCVLADGELTVLPSSPLGANVLKLNVLEPSIDNGEANDAAAVAPASEGTRDPAARGP
jgi:hypothetical protein